MKESKKRILGIFGLILVVAMTIFAYTLPEPKSKTISGIGEPVAFEK